MHRNLIGGEWMDWARGLRSRGAATAWCEARSGQASSSSMMVGLLK